MSSGLEDSSLFDLFRMEAEEQVRLLQAELVLLETQGATPSRLETLMRASHSLKGAARIVGLDPIVQLTHAMEDRFVDAQRGKALHSPDIDRMLAATDWLAKLQSLAESEMDPWLTQNADGIRACAAGFRDHEDAANPPPPAAEAEPSPAEDGAVSRPSGIEAPGPSAAPSAATTPPANSQTDIFAQPGKEERSAPERTVRLTAERLDQLLSLSAETLVAARQLASWGEVLERSHRAITKAQQMLEEAPPSAIARAALNGEVERQLAILAIQISEFQETSRTHERTAERLYRAVLGGRLRPFSECITGIPRLVRDVARDLAKSVRLEVLGDSTRVDRDILQRLEAPMSHLVTNAIDHGIESPLERLGAGKPAEAHLQLHARHENGRLVITVRDDGHGIDPEQVRRRVIHRNLATPETVARLTDQELLEFLFLPGFSTRDTASLLSGRGVGLNVVQSMVQQSGGSVTVTSTPGVGTTFRLTLPVTRSVVRVIRVLAEGELFSIPMVRIDHVGYLETQMENERLVAAWNGLAHPVIALASILGLSDKSLPKGPLPLLFSAGHAFAVDRFVDQAELSVRRLDPASERSPVSVRHPSTKTEIPFSSSIWMT